MPTVAEVGVLGYEAIAWDGIISPAGVPKGIVARLSIVVNAAIAMPTFKEKYRAIGNEPLGGTRIVFDAIAAENLNAAQCIETTASDSRPQPKRG